MCQNGSLGAFPYTSRLVERFRRDAKPTPESRFLRSVAEGQVPDDLRLLVSAWSVGSLDQPLWVGKFAMQTGQPEAMHNVPYSWKHTSPGLDDLEPNAFYPGLVLGTVWDHYEQQDRPALVSPSWGFKEIRLWPHPGKSSGMFAVSLEELLAKLANL
jgi:hypothetical protein